MTGRLKARCVAGVRDERGATAVFFAVGLLLLAPATMGLIDLYMITTQRGQLQDALDTATLYVARSTATSATDIQNSGDAALRANLKLPTGQTITSSSFQLAADKITIKGRATITPPTVGPRLWVQADIAASSEVLRNLDEPELWALVSRWADVGSYRRAFSGYEAKMVLTPLLLLGIDEPGAFDVPDAVGANVPRGV